MLYWDVLARGPQVLVLGLAWSILLLGCDSSDRIESPKSAGFDSIVERLEAATESRLVGSELDPSTLLAPLSRPLLESNSELSVLWKRVGMLGHSGLRFVGVVESQGTPLADLELVFRPRAAESGSSRQVELPGVQVQRESDRFELRVSRLDEGLSTPSLSELAAGFVIDGLGGP